MSKKTLVIGASDNPSRYSYLAVRQLAGHGHPVIALGKRAGQVGGIPIVTQRPEDKDIDTVTLYLNPANQEAYYDYILSLHPARLLFNPGTENDVLAEMARAKGIQPVEACTLVLLSTNQY
jgi:predicted CoA-binding protein